MTYMKPGKLISPGPLVRVRPACLVIVAVMGCALALSARAQFGPPNPDGNGDGKVTLAEFKAVSSTEVFRRLDSNKDGVMSRAEYQVAVDLMSRFAGASVAKRAVSRFADDDSNQDGLLTRSEMEAGAQKRFIRADANGDGSLDKAELKTTRQTARQDARD